MQFGNANMFWLLLSAALVYALGRWARRTRIRQLAAFTDLHLVNRLGADFDRLSSVRRRNVWLVTLAAFCFTVVLLRPQWGFTWKETSRRGVDIMVAIDTSDSMLAEDLKPSRLVRAQREVMDLLKHLQGDRVGLLLFSGTAFLEVPLTLDYGVFRLFLSSLSTDLIPIKGTNVESAITEGVAALDRGSRPASTILTAPKRDRALVLITDGEDFEGDLQKAGAAAKAADVLIYIVGIGTPEGAPIPTPHGYKQDEHGSVVISKLEEDKLQKLAADTGGIYVRSVTSDADTSAIYDMGIRRSLSGSSMKWGRGKRWNEYYQLPLLLGLLLLIVGPWGRLSELKLRDPGAGGETRTVRKGLLRSAGVKAAVLAVLLLGGPRFCRAESPEALGAEAKEAFEKADFDRALHGFAEASRKEGKDYRFKIGQGASYYRMQDFAAAKESFLDAAGKTEDPAAKAAALYDAANSMVQTGEFKDAISKYEESLSLVPEDQEAKDNLNYAKWLQQQQQQKQQQGSPQQQQTGGKQGSSADEKQDQSGSPSGADEDKEEKQQSADQANQSSTQSSGIEDNDAGKEQNKPQENTQQNPASGPEQNKQSAKADEKEEKRQAPPAAADQKGVSDQDQTLLDSIEEEPSARSKYRMQQGLKQLEAEKKRPPAKDW